MTNNKCVLAALTRYYLYVECKHWRTVRGELTFGSYTSPKTWSPEDYWGINSPGDGQLACSCCSRRLCFSTYSFVVPHFKPAAASRFEYASDRKLARFWKWAWPSCLQLSNRKKDILFIAIHCKPSLASEKAVAIPRFTRSFLHQFGVQTSLFRALQRLIPIYLRL